MFSWMIFRGSDSSAVVVSHVIAARAIISDNDSRETTLTASPLPPPGPYRLSQKQLRRLKAKLAKPPKARKIVKDLKKLPVPVDHSNKAFSLPAFEDPAISALLGLSSPAGILIDGGAQLGAFDLLAKGTSAIADASGRYAPTDRMSIFLCACLLLAGLRNVLIYKEASLVRTIQNTVFQFLQAFAALQAPELAPFVRYISNYLDMEFNAIRSQDKGKGVILAATWLLPLAIVPRPWDYTATKERLDH